jgi:endo-1,4-beta-xylanase
MGKNLMSMSLASTGVPTALTNVHAQTTLKDAFKNDFLIGAALNEAEITGQNISAVTLVKAQFNTISPENVLKWEPVHPEPDRYDFAAADRYVEFGQKNGMFVVGHTLVWHNQTPEWVFQDGNGKEVDRDTLLRRMRDHIHTVVGRYKSRIKGWDVVNEALNEDGTLRQSRWMKIIGEDYIAKAFEFAREADPEAELYYNDFTLEEEPKRKGAIELIKKLKARGIPITAVGLQGHLKMDWPTLEQEDATIADFARLDVKMAITELDIDIVRATQGNKTADINANAQLVAGADTYSNGLPDDVQQALAKRYADLFGVYLKHRDVIGRVTFWGVTDGDSWLNTQGRVNHPLLFARDGQPKPAFTAVIRVAAK